MHWSYHSLAQSHQYDHIVSGYWSVESIMPVTVLISAGYDSDVAREKDMDYMTKTYANPIRKAAGVKPSQQQYDSDDE